MPWIGLGVRFVRSYIDSRLGWTDQPLHPRHTTRCTPALRRQSGDLVATTTAAFVSAHHIRPREQTDGGTRSCCLQGKAVAFKFQEVSGQHNNFTRMASADSELLTKLIGPKIAKMGCPVPSQERLQHHEAFSCCRWLARRSWLPF